MEEPLPRSLGSSLHYHLGECFHRLGDEGKALSYWTKALRGNPDNALLRKKWKELAGAWLIGADLTGARMAGASLEGADLAVANLTGAIMDGAID